jgi:hypothetical protein
VKDFVGEDGVFVIEVGVVLVFREYDSTNNYGGTTIPVDTGGRPYQWVREHDCTSG